MHGLGVPHSENMAAGGSGSGGGYLDMGIGMVASAATAGINTVGSMIEFYGGGGLAGPDHAQVPAHRGLHPHPGHPLVPGRISSSGTSATASSACTPPGPPRSAAFDQGCNACDSAYACAARFFVTPVARLIDRSRGLSPYRRAYPQTAKPGLSTVLNSPSTVRRRLATVPAMDPVAALAASGGVARYATLRQRGVGPCAVQRRGSRHCPSCRGRRLRVARRATPAWSRPCDAVGSHPIRPRRSCTGWNSGDRPTSCT